MDQSRSARSIVPTTALIPESLYMTGPVDVVVTAVDDHPRYLDILPWWFAFWDEAARRWPGNLLPIALKFGTPLKVGDVAAASGAIINAPAPRTASTALAAQVSRVIWPALVPDTVRSVITTDVDMLPLNATTLSRPIAAMGHSMIIFRDVLEESRQFPICYSAAAPRTWRAVFGQVDDFTEELTRACQAAPDYSGIHGGSGWFTDQELLYSRVMAWEKAGGTVQRLDDSETGYRRIDRRHPPVVAWIQSLLVRRGFWSSYHAHFPAERHTRLLSHLLSQFRCQPIARSGAHTGGVRGE